jgi:hypothetical protein
MSAKRRRTIQYAVTSLFDFSCRGVLDAPPAEHDSAGDGENSTHRLAADFNETVV